MLRLSAMAAAALLSSGGLALAQTAPAPAASPQAAAAADPTNAQIASWIAGRHGEVDGVDAEPLAGPVRDGQIHGVVGASVGSGGYKSAYGVATLPIGQRGDVTVGISDEHGGGGNRGYGGAGYGYGGERRTLAIGVDLTGDHPQRCDRSLAWGQRSGGFGSAPDPACAADRAPTSQPER